MTPNLIELAYRIGREMPYGRVTTSTETSAHFEFTQDNRKLGIAIALNRMPVWAREWDGHEDAGMFENAADLKALRGWLEDGR